MSRILFCGKPLLHMDPGGEVQAFIDRHLSEVMLHMAPTQSSNSANRSRCCENLEPLAKYDWSEPPRLGLYEWWNPTGASRWSVLHVLMTQEEYVRCVAIPNGEQVLKLMWEKSSDYPPLEDSYLNDESYPLTYPESAKYNIVEVNMSIYRGVALTLQFAESTVYLVTLVDYRYWWQFIPAPEFTAGTPDYHNEWQYFFQTIKDTLTPIPDWVTFDAFNDSPWEPDLSQLNRPGESLPLILDAALGTFGKTYLLQPVSESMVLDVLTWFPHDPVTRDGEVIYVAGGSSNPDLSSPTIALSFQKEVNKKRRCDLAPYLLGNEDYEPTFGQLIHVSQPAKMANDGATVPTNLSDLNEWYAACELITSPSRPSGDSGVGFVNTSKLVSTQTFDSTNVDWFLIKLTPSSPFAVSARERDTHVLQHRHYAVKTQLKNKDCDEDDIIRFKLIENMPVCTDAIAQLLGDSSDISNCQCAQVRLILLKDTVGNARIKFQDGERFAPAGSMGFAKRFGCALEDDEEATVYEAISFGQGCCANETGSDDSGGCCQTWYTRFESLINITVAVDQVISLGHVIGNVGKRPLAEDFYELRYQAYFADECAIDLSGIHYYQGADGRAGGTSPCVTTASACAVNYALARMGSRRPLDDGWCGWKEISSLSGTGADYHERHIQCRPTDSTGVDAPVYNFTSTDKTTVYYVDTTDGVVLLKHECEEGSSSSSGGDCCVSLAQYDLRCVDGKLQKWIRTTEVCYNGDCLEKTSSEWTNTGEEEGCCECSGDVVSGSSGGTVMGCCYLPNNTHGYTNNVWCAQNNGVFVPGPDCPESGDPSCLCCPDAVTVTITIGDQTYVLAIPNTVHSAGFSHWNGCATFSNVPSCLADELLCEPGGTIEICANIQCFAGPALPLVAGFAYYYRRSDGVLCSCGGSTGSAYANEAPCGPSHSFSGTGFTVCPTGQHNNTDCTWTMAISPCGVSPPASFVPEGERTPCLTFTNGPHSGTFGELTRDTAMTIPEIMSWSGTVGGATILLYVDTLGWWASVDGAAATLATEDSSTEYGLRLRFDDGTNIFGVNTDGCGGAGSSTLAPMTMVATGYHPSILGAGTTLFAAMTSTGAGYHPSIVGAGAATFAALTSTGGGTFVAGITGVQGSTFSAMTSTGTGTYSIAGVQSITLAALTVVGEGTFTELG